MPPQFPKYRKAQRLHAKIGKLIEINSGALQVTAIGLIVKAIVDAIDRTFEATPEFDIGRAPLAAKPKNSRWQHLILHER